MTSHGCDGLGWVGMMAKDDRPFILQKAGGLQGIFYRLRPNAKRGGVHRHQQARFRRDVHHGKFANELLETIAPR